MSALCDSVDVPEPEPQPEAAKLVPVTARASVIRATRRGDFTSMKYVLAVRACHKSTTGPREGFDLPRSHAPERGQSPAAASADGLSSSAPQANQSSSVCRSLSVSGSGALLGGMRHDSKTWLKISRASVPLFP